jgi:pyrroloquinoline-quinone synthase
MPFPLIAEAKLLSHPWYQKWECGELPVESLRRYARDYYWQVANFPRYLSRLHSELEDLGQRQVVLKNLVEEESSDAPHPELWLDFAESLGLNRAEVKAGPVSEASRKLVEEFRFLMSSSPAEGLGAILAYESQVPEIARFKTEALEKHYLKGESLARGSRFFRVHAEADVWHTEELTALYDSLPEEQQSRAREAAGRACGALWRFLDEMPH